MLDSDLSQKQIFRVVELSIPTAVSVSFDTDFHVI